MVAQQNRVTPSPFGLWTRTWTWTWIVTIMFDFLPKDFTYGDDYFEKWVLNPEGANGAAIEHHKFAHLDCPLTPMRKSGHFVLAKFLNKERTEIAITGFQASGKKRIVN